MRMMVFARAGSELEKALCKRLARKATGFERHSTGGDVKLWWTMTLATVTTAAEGEIE